jgi:protein-disulfide isomerase
MSEHVPKLKLPVGDRDHVQGSPYVKVTLVEFGDYQCPYCGEAYSIVKRVQEKYRDELRFVFRNFPLTEIHPRAEFGAEMAEAAAVQGKFWEMHDYLYEHQAQLSNAQYFLEYAEKLGLDAKRIAEEIANHQYLPRIREDFSTGVRSGVNGTPTFFVNDLRHNGDYQFETFVAAIDGVLKPRASRPSAKTAMKKTTQKKKVRA